MSEETYAIELNLREWMDIIFALGYTQTYYKERGAKAKVKQNKQLHNEITEQIKAIERGKEP